MDLARCDLRDAEAVDRVLARTGRHFDACLFLAGNSDPAASAAAPGEDVRTNVLGIVNLLERMTTQRFVYFSSGAVYDGLSGGVSPRVHASPRLPYAINKLAAEHYVKWFAGRTLSAYIIVRFFGCYGPYESSRKIYTRLARAFGLERRREFRLRGDGKNLIDAMYVDDAVVAIQKLFDGALDNETIDLASGNPMALSDLVKRAATVFEIEEPVITFEGEVPEYITFHSQCDALARVSGFRPTTELADGLRRLVAHLAAS